MLKHSCTAPLAATLVALGIVLMSTPAFAVTIAASDDTWVRSDDSDSNRVNDAFTNARSQEGGSNDIVLLRFDVSALTAAVADASLNLYWYRNDGSERTLSLYGLNDGAAGETTWSQATVTYDDAPGVLRDDPVNTQDLDLANLTLLAENVPYGPQVEGDLYTIAGSDIADFLNADANGEVTLMIVRDLATSGNQARFASSRATSTNTSVLTGDAGFLTPYLDISLVPEPASAVLLSLGALALTGLARRRR